jgi:hypothetical protein
MDRGDNTYRKNLHDPDLTRLAELCANVANNSSDNKQSGTAYALRVEWVRLHLNRPPSDDKTGAEEESLKKRMAEFLVGVPSWMVSESWRASIV